jgi:hypothetical protein
MLPTAQRLNDRVPTLDLSPLRTISRGSVCYEPAGIAASQIVPFPSIGPAWRRPAAEISPIRNACADYQTRLKNRKQIINWDSGLADKRQDTEGFVPD